MNTKTESRSGRGSILSNREWEDLRRTGRFIRHLNAEDSRYPINREGQELIFTFEGRSVARGRIVMIQDGIGRLNLQLALYEAKLTPARPHVARIRTAKRKQKRQKKVRRKRTVSKAQKAKAA